MSDLFTAKVKYLKQNPEDGTISPKSETYILNALSFTEAEANLQERLEEYIPEYNLLDLKKENIQDVIVDEAFDSYFKVKVSYISADPDSGKEKKITENYLVQADTTERASEKMSSRLQGSIVDWKIPSISETKIVDFFQYA